MLSDDIAENLRRFFQWARAADPSDIGYPHSTPERKLLGGGLGVEGLSDDEGLLIDSALAALKAEDAEAHRVIVKVHAENRSFRWMESRGQGNRKQLARSLSDGHSFVAGFIRAGKIMGAQGGRWVPSDIPSDVMMDN
jgi:hypothetical protein